MAVSNVNKRDVRFPRYRLEHLKRDGITEGKTQTGSDNKKALEKLRFLQLLDFLKAVGIT